MRKIFYNEQGWVCKRYPYDLAVTNQNNFIEVDDEIYDKTLSCRSHFAWRVVNGELFEEQYDTPNEQETLDDLRIKREIECFNLVDRSALWYENLTNTQKTELKTWYYAWLDVTTTKIIPTKPSWLV